MTRWLGSDDESVYSNGVEIAKPWLETTGGTTISGSLERSRGFQG